SKYVAINPEDIIVQLDRKDDFEVLEVNIVLPESNKR
ncbi:MAG: cell division topological specificity factor MinE, partial [Burkholderiales bacterium]|nr:cell division topological specificity factor MinE [Burkholderiales bacterium]